MPNHILQRWTTDTTGRWETVH